MPRLDQTGPRGQGKMTGRGRGNCQSSTDGRGMRACGNGRRGRGQQGGMQDEIARLQEENATMKARLDALEA